MDLLHQLWCRAGWIAAHTTALCLWFDSPTLGPRFPIPRPIALLLGHIALGHVTLHRVASHHIRSCHSMSGCITVHRVASQRIRLHHSTSGCIRSCRIASGHIALHRVTSHCIRSGQSHYYQVGHAIIGPIWCAFPPCFCPAPLHTLPHHSLRRFNLYLHTSLFSFCHCDPGCLPLTLALPYPCHRSLRYF